MSDALPSQVKEPVIELRPESFGRNIVLALKDIFNGFKLWRLGWNLGWLDIKLRYRGSILGPFWITASTAVMIAAMGVLYAFLFHTNLREYLPFLTLSLVLWGYLNGILSDGCNSFTQAENLILSIRLPYSVYIWRIVVRNFLILLHNLLVVIVVFLIFRIVPQQIYLLIPVTFIWFLNSIALCILLGSLGTRFRDIPPVINSLTQIFFFITPIIWKPTLIFANRQYMLLNPFYPLLEIFRGPILGETLRPSIWIFALGYSLLLWLIALLIFSKTRFRIAYWM